MRHARRVNKLSRTAPHRKALMMNLTNALILNKRITTTLAKAKALRGYVEPLLTRAKTNDTHNRRHVFSFLKDKESIQTMFGEIAEKIATRPGGYTRIVKLQARPGDNADMALIELVDYGYDGEGKPAAGADAETKKRTRRGSKKPGATSTKAGAGDTTNAPDKNTDKKGGGSSKATGAPKIRQRKSGGA